LTVAALSARTERTVMVLPMEVKAGMMADVC
jgi:hypothetical protein